MSWGEGWRRRGKFSVFAVIVFFLLAFDMNSSKLATPGALKTTCQIFCSQTMTVKKFTGLLTTDMGRHGYVIPYLPPPWYLGFFLKDVLSI